MSTQLKYKCCRCSSLDNLTICSCYEQDHVFCQKCKNHECSYKSMEEAGYVLNTVWFIVDLVSGKLFEKKQK